MIFFNHNYLDYLLNVSTIYKLDEHFNENYVLAFNQDDVQSRVEDQEYAQLRGADQGDAQQGGADQGDAQQGGADQGDTQHRGEDHGGAHLRGEDQRDAQQGGADQGDTQHRGEDHGDAHLRGEDQGDAQPSGPVSYPMERINILNQGGKVSVETFSCFALTRVRHRDKGPIQTAWNVLELDYN